VDFKFFDFHNDGGFVKSPSAALSLRFLHSTWGQI